MVLIFSGIRASQILFRPANRVGPKKGCYKSGFKNKCNSALYANPKKMDIDHQKAWCVENALHVTPKPRRRLGHDLKIMGNMQTTTSKQTIKHHQRNGKAH